MKLVFQLILVCLFFPMSSVTAGELSNCDDVEAYAKKIADSMSKGVPKSSWQTLYQSRYSISNSIVTYVYSMKGLAVSSRIALLSYNRCQSGAYGSSLSDQGTSSSNVQIGNSAFVKKSPEEIEKNRKVMDDLIKRMN